MEKVNLCFPLDDLDWRLDHDYTDIALKLYQSCSPTYKAAHVVVYSYSKSILLPIFKHAFFVVVFIHTAVLIYVLIFCFSKDLC